MRTLKVSLLLLVGMLASQRAFAATPDELAQQRLYQEQQALQYERERNLRQQQEIKPEVRLHNQAPNTQIQPAVVEDYPTNETPCFIINKIELVGELAAQFNSALKDVTSGQHNAVSQCLGVIGINNALTHVQNHIVSQGFVTTRVLAAPQDIKTSTLQLTVIPGRVHAIRFSPAKGHYGARWNALPMNVGDVLNLRDIEQALENFKRVPTVEADIQIEPAQNQALGADNQATAVKPGDSDLVIRYQQSKPFRISVSADDSGSNSTGQYQAGITVSADNLFMLNDLAYVNFNHDLGGGDSGKRGTHGTIAHYSIPWDYWLLSATASDNKYNQSVAGATQTYIYSGTSQNAELELNRLIYRDATIKAGVSAGLFIKSSQNFIDDTEIEVQRRRTAGWQFGVNYSQYFGQASLDLQAEYKHGTGAFNALPAPEQAFGEGTSRFRLLTTNINLNVPLSVNAPWGTPALHYSATVRGQWNDSPLTPQDRFSIGNRYTVRGFDGQLTLAADRGWLIRSDLSAPIAHSGQVIYIGADYGEVGGQSSENLIGKYLAGVVAGLRGGYKSLQYDVFVGEPVNKPKGYQTHATTAGFSLNWTY
jgi:hemolysin activation/secretion protein